MEGLLSAFADGEWDSCDRNFLNDDADFMLHQLFSNEVGEGSSSNSVVPTTWSFLENDNNLTEAGQRSMYTDLNHFSTQHGFSGHREFGLFTSQLNSCNVPSESEYYTSDVVVEPPVTFFSNNVPETVPFRSELEMNRVEPDILTTITNTPLNLKRNLDISTSEVPKKKTRTTKNVLPLPPLLLLKCTSTVSFPYMLESSECRTVETRQKLYQRRPCKCLWTMAVTSSL